MGLRNGLIQKILIFYVPATHSKIRPNNSVPSGMLHFVLIHMDGSQPKKIELYRTNGS